LPTPLTPPKNASSVVSAVSVISVFKRVWNTDFTEYAHTTEKCIFGGISGVGNFGVQKGLERRFNRVRPYRRKNVPPTTPASEISQKTPSPKPKWHSAETSRWATAQDPKTHHYYKSAGGFPYKYPFPI